MFWLISIVIIFIDQVTKYIVRANILEGFALSVLGKFADLTYVKNTGCAFSLLSDRKAFLIVFTLILMAGIVVYYLKYKKTMAKAEMIAWSMVLGGGLGNLICRIKFGFVTDFIDIHFIPVFNFADICITLGCLLLFVTILFFEPKQKEKKIDAEIDNFTEDITNPDG